MDVFIMMRKIAVSSVILVIKRKYNAYCNLSHHDKHVHNLVIRPFETLIVDSKNDQYIIF